jgi:hypothetical protein
MGAPSAKVTADPEEASRLVAGGTPVVLVGEDGERLGRGLCRSPDEGRRERLLGVMVGPPGAPDVAAAALEMASELWPWSDAR